MDILRMSQAGLSDVVIVAKIRSSKCDFDTSAEALIKLKTAGVSQTVLAAMMEGGTVVSPHVNLPSGYGYYIYSAGSFNLLTPSQVKLVTGLQNTVMAANFVVDGFGEDAIPSNLGNQAPEFLVYQQNIDTMAVHFARLELVRSMEAQEFDIGNITNSGQFDQFRNIYGVARTQHIQVNLWGPRATEIPLRTEPVPEKPGMFRVSPVSSLSAGRYALYYRNALHPNLIVNYKGSSDQDAVFYFTVEGDSNETSTSGTSSGKGYDDLMRDGHDAFKSQAWDRSLTDFQAAAKSDSTGLAWMWVGNALLATGRWNEFGAAWDQALKQNHPLALPVCLAHGISQCQQGDLELGQSGVRFISNGATVFEGSASEVIPRESVQHNTAGYADFKLEFSGKKYNLIFVPYGVECQVLAHVNCRGTGTQQQKAVGDYIEQLIRKLAAAGGPRS